MENVVYVVFDMDNIIIGVFRTLESAKECALGEIEEVCNKSGFNNSEKTRFISELNDELYVDDIVYISSEKLYD